MKMIAKLSLVFMSILALSFSASAQKKVKSFEVSKVIELPADQIWSVMGQDYGAVANSHPKIISSEYLNGSLSGEEGAERVCYFNESGSRYLKEKIISFDNENRTLINKVYQAGKFPVDPDYTQAVYKVKDLGNGSSLVSFDMQFRTKPAFLGGMMKSSFKNLIKDYFIAIEHHIRTGEIVNKDNFKSIKKAYRS